MPPFALNVGRQTAASGYPHKNRAKKVHPEDQSLDSERQTYIRGVVKYGVQSQYSFSPYNITNVYSLSPDLLKGYFAAP